MDDNHIPLSSAVAESLYKDFDTFVAQYEKLSGHYRFDNLPILGLIRLARNDFAKAKRVFEWAVVLPCLQLHSGYQKSITTLSPQGMDQLESARSRFGQNPQLALMLIESIFVIESIGSRAQKAVAEFQPGMTLAEFRNRPDGNDEQLNREGWLDQLYENVGARAVIQAEEYARVRDCAIMIAIVGLADGAFPTADEIKPLLSGLPPTRFRAKQQRVQYPFAKMDIDRSISGTGLAVEWVLGQRWDEIPF